MHGQQLAFQVFIHQHQRTDRAVQIAVTQRDDLVDLNSTRLPIRTTLLLKLARPLTNAELGRN